MAEALARREKVLREGFGAIRTMLEHARRGTAMEFWGDGETMRDFLLIEDWVEACWRLLAPQAPVGVYNVGVGEGCSLNTLRGGGAGDGTRIASSLAAGAVGGCARGRAGFDPVARGNRVGAATDAGGGNSADVDLAGSGWGDG
jgi:hypothetical protein